MTAQTGYERLKAYRQRKAEMGESEVRGIFAPKELHAKIKEEAKKITKRP
jgi:hypothetical protein